MAEIFGVVGAKMGPRWTQDGPSWEQVVPKIGHDGAKMAISGSVWQLFGLWSLFFDDLCKNGRSVKTNHTTAVWVFFWGSGLPLEGPGSCLWERFGGFVGSKMVLS